MFELMISLFISTFLFRFRNSLFNSSDFDFYVGFLEGRNKKKYCLLCVLSIFYLVLFSSIYIISPGFSMSLLGLGYLILFNQALALPVLFVEALATAFMTFILFLFTLNQYYWLS